MLYLIKKDEAGLVYSNYAIMSRFNFLYISLHSSVKSQWLFSRPF
jgi:hypothetical protein